MSLNSLRNEARNNLTVTANVINQQGGDIDVGEQFTVRFTVRNNFTGGNGESPGHAHYRNVRLQVAGTNFASVVDGNRTIDITDHLGFDGSESTDVTFQATDTVPASFFNWWPSEPYAGVTALADFDIDRFFRIVQSETFSTQIENG